MDRADALTALQLTGDRLAAEGVTHKIVVILGGGIAAMVIGRFPPERVTHDCDVFEVSPEECWDEIERAAADVGRRLGLPRTWLNRDSSMYRSWLPTGWHHRCEPLMHRGPLKVRVLGRRDLLASKILGAPQRPQDLEDLRALMPTTAEVEWLRRHLQRLQSESLGSDEYAAQHDILKELES